MKDYAKSFYKSKAWINTSKLYLGSKFWICERCGKPAEICHHKIWLTPNNIKDFNIALSFDNLEALCMDCHNIEHMRTGAAVYFDDAGNIAHVKEDRTIAEHKATDIDLLLERARELQQKEKG